MWSSERKRKEDQKCHGRATAKSRSYTLCGRYKPAGRWETSGREMGVSQQAFYDWKKRYAGVGVSELRELRQLREENRKLKTLVADLTSDRHILQEVLSKKV